MWHHTIHIHVTLIVFYAILSALPKKITVLAGCLGRAAGPFWVALLYIVFVVVLPASWAAAVLSPSAMSQLQPFPYPSVTIFVTLPGDTTYFTPFSSSLDAFPCWPWTLQSTRGHGEAVAIVTSSRAPNPWPMTKLLAFDASLMAGLASSGPTSNAGVPCCTRLPCGLSSAKRHHRGGTIDRSLLRPQYTTKREQTTFDDGMVTATTSNSEGNFQRDMSLFHWMKRRQSTLSTLRARISPCLRV